MKHISRIALGALISIGVMGWLQSHSVTDMTIVLPIGLLAAAISTVLIIKSIDG